MLFVYSREILLLTSLLKKCKENQNLNQNKELFFFRLRIPDLNIKIWILKKEEVESGSIKNDKDPQPCLELLTF